MCLSPIYLKQGIGAKPVPCQKCSECLSKRRQDWFIRIKYHAKQFKQNAFVTFTYDDENIPMVEIDRGTGCDFAYSLWPRDMQLYFKSLRKDLGTRRISYYLVGEYGTHTLRPHYHAIIFNLGRSDADIIKRNWKKGISYVGSASDASINYVCKYHLLRGETPTGCEPSFCRMSKNLGLGYVFKHYTWHNDDVMNRDYIYLDGFKKPLPRYYKEYLFKKEDRLKLMAQIEKKQAKRLDEEFKNHQDVNFYENRRYQIAQKNRKFKRKTEESGSL